MKMEPPNLDVWIGSGRQLTRSARCAHSFNQWQGAVRKSQGLRLVLADSAHQITTLKLECEIEERIDMPRISINTHARSFATKISAISKNWSEPEVSTSYE